MAKGTEYSYLSKCSIKTRFYIDLQVFLPNIKVELVFKITILFNCVQKLPGPENWHILNFILFLSFTFWWHFFKEYFSWSSLCILFINSQWIKEPANNYHPNQQKSGPHFLMPLNSKYSCRSEFISKNMVTLYMIQSIKNCL